MINKILQTVVIIIFLCVLLQMLVCVIYDGYESVKEYYERMKREHKKRMRRK